MALHLDAYTKAGTDEAIARALADAQASFGTDGQPRFAGVGPPPITIVGARPSDYYLDVTTGDLYQLT